MHFQCEKCWSSIIHNNPVKTIKSFSNQWERTAPILKTLLEVLCKITDCQTLAGSHPFFLQTAEKSNCEPANFLIKHHCSLLLSPAFCGLQPQVKRGSSTQPYRSQVAPGGFACTKVRSRFNLDKMWKCCICLGASRADMQYFRLIYQMYGGWWPCFCMLLRCLGTLDHI